MAPKVKTRRKGSAVARPPQRPVDAWDFIDRQTLAWIQPVPIKVTMQTDVYKEVERIDSLIRRRWNDQKYKKKKKEKNNKKNTSAAATLQRSYVDEFLGRWQPVIQSLKAKYQEVLIISESLRQKGNSLTVYKSKPGIKDGANKAAEVAMSNMTLIGTVMRDLNVDIGIAIPDGQQFPGPASSSSPAFSPEPSPAFSPEPWPAFSPEPWPTQDPPARVLNAEMAQHHGEDGDAQLDELWEESQETSHGKAQWVWDDLPEEDSQASDGEEMLHDIETEI